MSTLDELNTEVTTAIIAADEALRYALVAWERVEREEAALATVAPNREEQAAAERGIAYARTKIDLLKLMLGLLTDKERG